MGDGVKRVFGREGGSSPPVPPAQSPSPRLLPPRSRHSTRTPRAPQRLACPGGPRPRVVVSGGVSLPPDLLATYLEAGGPKFPPLRTFASGGGQDCPRSRRHSPERPVHFAGCAAGPLACRSPPALDQSSRPVVACPLLCSPPGRQAPLPALRAWGVPSDRPAGSLAPFLCRAPARLRHASRRSVPLPSVSGERVPGTWVRGRATAVG